MEIYAFTSYGNDSIALIQWLREHNGEGVEVTTLYSDTGWAAAWWAERVERPSQIQDAPADLVDVE